MNATPIIPIVNNVVFISISIEHKHQNANYLLYTFLDKNTYIINSYRVNFLCDGWMSPIRNSSCVVLCINDKPRGCCVALHYSAGLALALGSLILYYICVFSLPKKSLFLHRASVIMSYFIQKRGFVSKILGDIGGFD